VAPPTDRRAAAEPWHRPVLRVALLSSLLGLVAVLTWWAGQRNGRTPLVEFSSSQAAWVGPTIRVALSESSVATATVRIDGAFSITAVGNPRVLHRGTSLGATTLRVTPEGFRIGKTVLAAKRLEISVARDPGLWIDGHLYRGRVRCERVSDNRLRVVNLLPLESYLASVVDGEMPRDFGREARAAQAVAARTYALMAIREAPADALWDLYATVRSQKYLGVKYTDSSGNELAGESESSRAAVATTSGWVLTYRGKLFRPYYAACCGGQTLRGSELFPEAAPPHSGVACRYCKEATWYRWTIDLSVMALSSKLKPLARSRGRTLTAISAIEPVPSTGAETLSRFRVRQGQQSFEATGQDLRLALASDGAKSPRMSIQRTATGYRITGRGHGHGAGMCQWGARGQAAAGRTARQILEHYYPGATIARAANLAPAR
jgi:stage II sporulation protein D